MKYEEAVEYIASLASYGIVPGLENIRQLCERLGNPQEKLQVIHIAGTNGKGSVSAYLSMILKTAGYKVGRYISPVIFNDCEKIQVNQRNISKKDLCVLTEKIKNICDRMVEEGLPHPTPFEVETAMAFAYFEEKQCDLVVLETGMGGRLDATNVVQNVVAAVITSISMDHMKFLGHSLGEIAANKAGIIKPDCQVISAVQEEEAMREIRRAAHENGVPLHLADETKVKKAKYHLEGTEFTYGEEKEPFTLSLLGRYQVQNALLAIETVYALQRQGFAVSGRQLRKGLALTKWPCRFELLSKKPILIADGAHNEDGAKKLADSIRFYFTNRKIIYIMGILRDKEYEKIIAETSFLAEQIITVTPPDNPRAMNGLELAEAVRGYHPNVTAADSVEEAVELGFLLAGKTGVIVAFGSLSYMGRLEKCVEKRIGNRKDDK